MLREWEKLPKFMQTEEVRPYYDSLKKKKISLEPCRRDTFPAIALATAYLVDFTNNCSQKLIQSSSLAALEFKSIVLSM